MPERLDRATNLVRVESDQTAAARAGAHVHVIEFIAKTSAGLVHVLDPQRLLSDQAARAIIRIDWQELRAHPARAQAGLAAAGELSAEQAKAVMDERARALALVPARAPDRKEILEVMTARLAGARIAIGTRFVRGVHRPAEVTPVPGSPAFLVGVNNLRGDVLAVRDLRDLFGLPAAETSERPQTVILGCSVRNSA